MHNPSYRVASQTAEHNIGEKLHLPAAKDVCVLQWWGKRKNIWGTKPPSSSYASMRVTVHSMFTCSALLSDRSSCFPTKSEARSKEGYHFCKKHISKSNSAWESYGKWVKNVHFNYQVWSIKNSNINFKHSKFFHSPHKSRVLYTGPRPHW